MEKSRLELVEARVSEALGSVADMVVGNFEKAVHSTSRSSNGNEQKNQENILVPVEAERKPVRGDIICVRRIHDLVEHYGVYVGDDRVIHYTPSTGEIGLDLAIRETSLGQFLNAATTYYICLFPEDYTQDYGENDEYREMSKEDFEARKGILARFRDRLPWHNTAEYHIYGPDETIKRAQTRLGESEYSLLSNNCEHFALWCKTNISESYQISNLIKDIRQLPFIFRDDGTKK